jgi:hypothetical protein
VATLNPQTPLGRLRLDAGDAAQVCLLSDELRMDEIAALVCLVTAQDEVREHAGERGWCPLVPRARVRAFLFLPAQPALTTSSFLCQI